MYRVVRTWCRWHPCGTDREHLLQGPFKLICCQLDVWVRFTHCCHVVCRLPRDHRRYLEPLRRITIAIAMWLLVPVAALTSSADRAAVVSFLTTCSPGGGFSDPGTDPCDPSPWYVRSQRYCGALQATV